MAEQHQQIQQQHHQQGQHITAQILNVQGGVATLEDSTPIQIMMPTGVVNVMEEQQQVPQHVQEMQEVVPEAIGGAQGPLEDPKLANKKELSKQWKSLCKRAKQWCSMHDDSVPNFVMMYLDENRLVWEGPDHMESFISDEGVISAFLRTAALSESLIGMEKRGADDIQEMAQRPAKKQKKSAETTTTSKKGMTDDEVIASILEKPEAESQDSTQDIGAGGDDNDSSGGGGQAADGDQPSQSTSEGPSQGGEGDVLSQVIESVIKEWAPGQGPPPRTSPGEEEGDGSEDKDGTTDVYLLTLDEGNRLPKGQLEKTTLGKSELKSKMEAQSDVLTIVRSRDIYVYKTVEHKEPSFSFNKKKRKGVPRRLRRSVLPAKNNLAFHCNLCSKTFKTSQKLTLHLRRHAGEKPYQCDQCDKRFYMRYMLRTHEKLTHEGQRPFACEHCSAKFTQKRHLKMHTNIYHNNIVREMTVNPEGRLVLAKERNHICEACNRRFLSNSDLARHLRIHTGEKPFSCGSCQKGFARKSDLTKHVRIHTGEKPYACSHCGQRFRELSNMKSHARTHTKEQWTCQICGKVFPSSKSLRTHNLTHAQGEAVVATITIQEGAQEHNERLVVTCYENNEDSTQVPTSMVPTKAPFRSPVMLIPTQPRGIKLSMTAKPDQSDPISRTETPRKRVKKPEALPQQQQQPQIVHVQTLAPQLQQQPLSQTSHHQDHTPLPQHTVASHVSRPYDEEEFNPAAVLQSLQIGPQVHISTTPQSMGGPVSYAQVYPATGVPVFRNMYSHSQPMTSYMTFQSSHDHGHVQHPAPHSQHTVQHAVSHPGQGLSGQTDEEQQLMMHQQHDLQSLLRK